MMKRRFLLAGLALAILVLALGGWTVRGIRWTLAAPRQPRAKTA
jgi:hypothetical protein